MYLGRREIAKGANWSDKKIIRELTAVTAEYSPSAVEQAIVAYSPDFEGRSPSKMVSQQVGEYLRFLVSYN